MRLHTALWQSGGAAVAVENGGHTNGVPEWRFCVGVRLPLMNMCRATYLLML